MIKTLDGVERKLEPFTTLVCDEAGSPMAGIMGGEETEVSDQTTNVLLEGAVWNMINIRKTAKAHNLNSEASYRMSRGVHPVSGGTRPAPLPAVDARMVGRRSCPLRRQMPTPCPPKTRWWK